MRRSRPGDVSPPKVLFRNALLHTGALSTSVNEALHSQISNSQDLDVVEQRSPEPSCVGRAIRGSASVSSCGKIRGASQRLTPAPMMCAILLCWRLPSTFVPIAVTACIAPNSLIMAKKLFFLGSCHSEKTLSREPITVDGESESVGTY